MRISQNLRTFAEMISPKYIILLFLGCLALVWACSPSTSPDKSAAEISEAYNKSNIDEARSKADALFASGVKLDTIAVPRLCMLSITLAKLSENAGAGNDYTAQALNCYRTALRHDSVTASSFYRALSGDDFKYYQLLQQLEGRVDARSEGIRSEEPDSIHG